MNKAKEEVITYVSNGRIPCRSDMIELLKATKNGKVVISGVLDISEFLYDLRYKKRSDINLGNLSFPDALKANRALSNFTDNAPIVGIDLPKARDVSYFLEGEDSFNQPIEGLNLPEAVNATEFLGSCYSFNQSLSGLKLPKVTTVQNFLDYCSNFNSEIEGIEIPKVTNMAGFLCDCEKFNQPLNKLDMSKVVDITEMLCRCISFNQPLDEWDLSSVKYYKGAFRNTALSIDQVKEWEWDSKFGIDLDLLFDKHESDLRDTTYILMFEGGKAIWL